MIPRVLRSYLSVGYVNRRDHQGVAWDVGLDLGSRDLSVILPCYRAAYLSSG